MLYGLLNVRIIEDLPIGGYQRTSVNPRSSDNDLVGGIPVKLSRQRSRFGCDFRSQIEELNSRIGKTRIEPVQDRERQRKSPALHQLGDLPAGDHADSKATRLVSLQGFEMLAAQSAVAMNPPDPDVSIEDDHLSASQSDSATGSIGSS